MMDNYYAVIMAGGGGTRLWPISRRECPKQFMKIQTERSLFQIAIDRLEGLFPADHIFIVTVAAQVEGLHAEYPAIPLENFIIEPMPGELRLWLDWQQLTCWIRTPMRSWRF